jgi:PKD repeat protein
VQWNFGDGLSSTLQSPTHNYTSAGDYDITLTVTNAAGSTSSLTKQIHFTPAPPPPPITPVGKPPYADFSVNLQTVFFVYDQLSFQDLSTGIPTSWLWDFGDGATSTEQNPTHSYVQEGNYRVIMTASNSAGNDVIRIENCVSVTSNAFKLYCLLQSTSH